MENETTFRHVLEPSTSVEQKREAKWRKRKGIKIFRTQPQPELRCGCTMQDACNLVPVPRGVSLPPPASLDTKTPPEQHERASR